MRHDLVIFDFDGTLADSGEWFFGSLNDVADRFGFRRTTVEEREALRRLGNHEIIRKLRVPMWKMPAIAAYMRRRATEDIESIQLFEGVAPALRMLRQRGMKLAIVSSNTEQNVRTVLGPELVELINFYGCGSSMFGKAVKFRRAMKQLGTAPERTICVGDETRDIEAANAVGASSAAVTWGFAAPESLRRLKPTLLLEQVHELGRLAG
ncbi:HAD hydrolase-like protein [Rhizobium mesoamericanum]|uniref:Phosphoglycolate phosphatase n=1 Tax=Rhizobium mesoamericanum STM3625 TaxID=1211777 RepID=K0Q2X1_9HYPH|nr:HAD hydrolase-like protein [Rhizobium mesoamericanum]CCM76904.1 Phosphoglycolate phosphatase [Rhizobium mesoamericanum STM3625]